MLNLPSSLPPAIDTPVKGRKQAEPLTAESDQDISPGFEDISAEELFRQFNQLVRVTEEEHETEDSEDIERKLTYDQFPTYRLEFEPKSSMKKQVEKKDLSMHRASVLFRPEPLGEIKHDNSQIDCECFTPVDRVKKEHPELLMTPHKEQISQ
jgi:hypothetical protein